MSVHWQKSEDEGTGEMKISILLSCQSDQSHDASCSYRRDTWSPALHGTELFFGLLFLFLNATKMQWVANYF